MLKDLERRFGNSPSDSDKKWQDFKDMLVNHLDVKDINEYTNNYKLVGGEIFSNV